MRPLLVFTALLLLAGCSSWQPDAEDIEPVPAERVLAYQQPLENGGEVVVTRDFGLRGGGCYIAVLIDRQLAARIHVGEVVRIQVPAGARIVSIGTDPLDDTLCGKLSLRREKLAQVQAGQTLEYRVISDNRIGFDIIAVEP
ncbi:3-isopropylmalate dehydratase [Stutzerimonas stutzeri]|uniref:3-isopropylmalate dehydratase n=1 Tax=Stutzerimonas stutzeri TaxID=316 RepID=UPI000F7A7DB7|nr:3-isopropylmalate dehydratase [Stutzerimonas stutzeri]MBW8454365.1 3-isopropylmalate dehydratase [Pseudomonas sp.]RRV62717.1 3-isopropylmalate dehydratase [Stutzerimonas stutzeri]RTM20674.1 3-isopropylmalate dehydratase [Stutzerimonas stutzeri]